MSSYGYYFTFLSTFSCLFCVAVTGVSPPYEVLGEKAEIYPLPPLQYGYEELEPWIDAATVKAHYEGHHETYRKKANALLAQWRDQEPQNAFVTESALVVLERLDQVPDVFRQKIRNSLGGFVNHCLYWSVMSPNPSGVQRMPSSKLLEEIQNTFGSFEGFKAAFNSAAIDLFGSGYVWLVRYRNEPTNHQLTIISSTNQDCPLSEGAEPLLVIDLWEHAYYLKHQYRRMQHMEDWWKLVDWSRVEQLDQFWVTYRSPKPPQREEF